MTTTLCPHCRQELTWLPLNGIEIPTNSASVNDPNAKKFDIEKGHRAHFETCERYRAGAIQNNRIGVEMVEALRQPAAEQDPDDESDHGAKSFKDGSTYDFSKKATDGDTIQQPAEAEGSEPDNGTS